MWAKTLEIAKIYLAAGIDPRKCTLFAQSQVKEHTELMWILNALALLDDTEKLAQDGMVVIAVVIENKSKKILGNVQITSRGFIYVKENFDLVNEAKRKVQDVIKKNTAPGMQLDWENVKNQLRENIGQLLFTKTECRPMVLLVVIEV